MRRMWSLKQLKDIADVQAKAVQKDISTLVDKDGHPRFIEGVIDTTGLPTGVTSPYAKWSLSGTHLMIVLCFAVASGTSVGSVKFVEFELPKWIYDKIVPVFGSYIEDKGTLDIRGSDASKVGEFLSNMSKIPSNKLRFAYRIANATTADGFIRLSFDLLIDND